MFNLGLAHAKAGNELLADVWLRAYLAAMPDAPNAAAVKAEIGRLEAVVEAKVRRLFEQAVAAAEEIPVEGETRDSSTGRREEALTGIAWGQFEIGDFQGAGTALQRARKVGLGKYDYRDLLSEKYVLGLHAKFLAKADDIEGAEKNLNKISAAKNSDYWEEIFHAKVRTSDLRGANTIFDQFDKSRQSNNSQELSMAYAGIGDSAAAEAIARKASAVESYVYSALSIRVLHQGNISEALKYARQAMMSGSPGAHIRVIAGDRDRALNDLASNEIGGWGGSHNESALFGTTKDLLILGDLPSARRAASFARQWASEPKGRAGEHNGAYASLAEACVLIAEDRRPMIKAKIEEAVAAFKPYFLRAYIEGNKRDIALLAIQIGRLEAAEIVVDTFIRTSMKIDLLRRLREAHGKKGDAANASRIEKRLAGLEAATRMGWAAKTPAQEKAITAWMAAADQINQHPMLPDFQRYLTQTKEFVADKSPDRVPSALTIAAMEIMKELTRIRAMAARLEKQSN
jgi:tetratricopeptide (TPR) repeat protein